MVSTRTWKWAGEDGEEEVDEDGNETAWVGPFRVGEGPQKFGHDGLGSVTSQSDGAFTSTAEYSAWGQISTAGAMPSSAAYAGGRVESLLGLNYNRRRWLDSTSGSFLSRDEVGASSYLSSPNGISPWSYAHQQPGRFIDPDGRDDFGFPDFFGQAEREINSEAAHIQQQLDEHPLGQFANGFGKPILAALEQQRLTFKVTVRDEGTPEERAYVASTLEAQREEGLKTAVFGPAYLAFSLPATFKRVGTNLGEEIAACTVGEWTRCGELPWSAAEGWMLAEGGRAALKTGVEIGVVPEGGVLTAPAREALNPKKYSGRVDLVMAVGPVPPIPVPRIKYTGTTTKLINGEFTLLESEFEPVPAKSTNGLKAGVPGPEFKAGNVTEDYVRPRAAGPTAEQRASVQGKPCVDCQVITPNQVADHIDPLSVEFFRTGKNDVKHQSSTKAVQPHCPTCSAIQGGQLSAFVARMRALLGL
ncbi:MAG: hypothetical protein DI536_36280 [Archangium gephyra]|uniref:HNH endonuclease n=1 Tax=Archangium gephyra TaxID=48 RepID=A0A2W5SKZ6_9BACT|nr:MAG: hypothetical protein DI536_36280 [Archangium gephyra]